MAAGGLALGFPRAAKADYSDFTWNPSTPPNILIIMVDQLRYQELSAATPGLATVLPNITTLQGQSVEFTNFFVAATCCTPSRAAFLTGLYPTQTCMYITQGNGADPSLNTSFPTYASYLSSASGLGYETAYFGKWHLSNESPDLGDPDFTAYGFTITGNESPSPDGFANEGMTGGTFDNPPHEGTSGYWMNDQEIVRNFSYYLGNQLANQTGTISPWCAVVSLINPHDISNYPLMLLNYCSLPSPSPIQPYYPPQAPGAAPTWAVSGTPDFPPLYEFFSYTGAQSAPACSSAPLPFSTYTTIPGLTTPNAKPTNTSELQGSPKPSLQYAWQDAIFGLCGTIQEPLSSPANGDWGQFLNVYYWLASCTDQLIGNLASADPHLIVYTDGPFKPCTILGQYAALLESTSPLTSAQKTALENTVIVFTADHGELGGAHSLPQKHACSYDEAIHVPLFVHLPGQSTNTLRPQMVSSVDFFGLICGLAQPTYNGSGVPTWQAANTQLATRTDMIYCLESASNAISNRTINIAGTQVPYVMHTYNEWFKSYYTQTPWAAADPCHVVCLRTATQKLVFYDTWATAYTTPSSQQAGFNSTDFLTTGSGYASAWTTTNAEYYDLSSNAIEEGNSFANPPTAGTTQAYVQAAFKGSVDNELQASLPSSLVSARSSAKTVFQTYITAPSLTGITNSTGGSTITEGSDITLYLSGSYLGIGATITIINTSTSATVFYDPLDDTVSVSAPIQLILSISAGSYGVTITNPSGLTSPPLDFTGVS